MLGQNASIQIQQRGQSVAAEMLLVVTSYDKTNTRKCSGSAFEATREFCFFYRASRNI